MLVQQLLLKKFCAELHENVADLSLILGHEQMDGLVDRHDIHTKCSFYYSQNAYQPRCEVTHWGSDIVKTAYPCDILTHSVWCHLDSYWWCH